MAPFPSSSLASPPPSSSVPMVSPVGAFKGRGTPVTPGGHRFLAMVALSASPSRGGEWAGAQGGGAGGSGEGADEGHSPRMASAESPADAPPPPMESLSDRMAARHAGAGAASPGPAPAASATTQGAAPAPTQERNEADSGAAVSLGSVSVPDGWVTLFGFPAHLASAAYAAFATCGEVAEVSRWGVPSGGNFVHVRFANVDAARLAVRRATVEIAPGLIVGARPTTDKHRTALAARHAASSAVPLLRAGGGAGGGERAMASWPSAAAASAGSARPVMPSAWSRFVEFVVGV